MFTKLLMKISILIHLLINDKPFQLKSFLKKAQVFRIRTLFANLFSAIL